jgi:lysosomal Pro-X carboxypeptidase
LDDLSTENLIYLSSEQALADLSLFIQFIKQKYNAVKSPVITFGGSYPGNLAAWFRLKYPFLTVGSIASRYSK